MTKREVATEIAQVLVDPKWQDVNWISGLDLMLARDADVTDEPLDEHLKIGDIPRETCERLAFLRANLGPDHREHIEDALENTQKAGLVELLAYTCTSAKQFTAALERAGARKDLQLAIDYGMRRFIHEPAVAKQLAKRGKPFATTAHGGKWKEEGSGAWRALYVCNTKESGDVVAEMIAQTYIYTNHGPKERISAAAAKRARLLKHNKACAKPLVEAAGESYTNEEFAHSAAAISKAAKKVIEDKWNEYGEYSHDNNPCLVTLGALLALSPKSRRYQDIAKKVFPKLLKEKENVGWDDVGQVNGIVMGIEKGRIRALYPLLEKVVKWKITGSPYDNHGAARAELAAALVRRRAARTLDAG